MKECPDIRLPYWNQFFSSSFFVWRRRWGFLFLTTFQVFVSSYSTGDLHHRHIAGIWKFTSAQKSFMIPPSFILAPKNKNTDHDQKDSDSNDNMFELETIHIEDNNSPQQQQKQQQEVKKDEILLLLREDGTFMQYSGISSSSSSSSSMMKTDKNIMKKRKTDNRNVDEYQQTIHGVHMIMKGIWDFVDGKLILATERPPTSTSTSSVSSTATDSLTISTQKNINMTHVSLVKDTILEGRIIATKEQSLLENPALVQPSTVQNTPPSPSSPLNKSGFDIYLSVPNGQVKIGKFIYPQNHPSFFEQPLFEPIPMGSFQLQQIAGMLNTQVPFARKDREDQDPMDDIELFQKEDLMNKKYFLTSYPLPSFSSRQRRQRWSIKYNTFVDAKPKSKEEQAREEEEENAPFPIQSFEIELFANNTFCTRKGFGQDKILRGKWWIFGDQRDQIVIQVARFGFGRSVSGSTYSEGAALTQKDIVSYWGKIYEVDGSEEGETGMNNNNNIENDPLTWKGKKIEVNGSVMEGWGLEPCSVARFTMVEKTEFEDEEEEEEDEYEDDDDSEDEDDSDNVRNEKDDTIEGEFQ